MYSKPFFIEDSVGNNALGFEHRSTRGLFVPSLREITSLDEVEQGSEMVFEDLSMEDAVSLRSCTGLANFYHMTWQGKPMYIFDNHNHAYFFWYLARDNGVIQDGAKLYHIDEHSDMRDIDQCLMKPDSFDLEKVFAATNFSEINVGNYILPAQREGIVSEIVQIRNEHNLHEYNDQHKQLQENNIILNLDLDFFQPDLDFIDYELKKQVTLDAAAKADVITIATSPFFIDQDLALKVLRDIFTIKK